MLTTGDGHRKKGGKPKKAFSGVRSRFGSEHNKNSFLKHWSGKNENKKNENLKK